MAVGDSAAWAGRFRSFDRRFLERVTAVWPRCLAVLPDRPDEDAVTTNLVDLLERDSGIRRRFHWIEFQYEPFGRTPQGAAYSKGRIDVAVFLNQDRDRYLAYECKRLNDVREDGRRSLAGEYVMEGLSRFVAERYSENLPVGCMLGYVLDGDVAYAASSVRERIVACRRKIALIGQPKDEAAVGVATRFSSRHRRQDDGEIEVRHALLPMRLDSPWWNPASHRERRGARLTRREEGAYWAYATDEQRRQAGCIAARMQRGLSPRAVKGTTAEGAPASLP